MIAALLFLFVWFFIFTPIVLLVAVIAALVA